MDHGKNQMNHREHLDSKGRMRRKILAWTALVLGVGQITLMLASWLMTAAWPEDYTRCLLSAEGIRWFFGHFQDNLASPVLVWLVVGSIAYGSLVKSGILRYDAKEYRQRFALGVANFELGVFVVIMLVLTLLPHAILLNVMGGLVPSSFTQSIVPYCSFAVTVITCSFGVVSGNIVGVEGIFRAMTSGVAWAAPLLVLYVLAAQLVYSIVYLM